MSSRERLKGWIETVLGAVVLASLIIQVRIFLPTDENESGSRCAAFRTCMSILEEIRNGRQGELIFPNPDGGVFSENAMLAVLDRVGYSHVTVHGFRSTFATWGEECTDYPDGVREAALAHKYKSETTAAYQRGQKLEKRRVLMKDWAQFLAGSNVIRLDKAG
jgi:hypothetical protein